MKSRSRLLPHATFADYRQRPRTIIPAIRALGTNPRPSRVKKLAGRRDLYRIRVGDYRVIYAIDDSVRVVSVTRIGHRSNVYG